MLTHTLGFPRIGHNRELKRAQEAYWKHTIEAQQLLATADAIRARHWQLQRDAGVDLVPVGDFSLYDHILDMTATLGAVPARFDWSADTVDLETYFRMARGAAGTPAMEMTKWFDTNYHYIVPEFSRQQTFRLASGALINATRACRAGGFTPKPVLPGPLTYLFLGKEVEAGMDRWMHLDAIVSVYETLLAELATETEWIQLDEPILVLDLPDSVRARFAPVYRRLRAAAGNAKLMLATYFGALEENTETALTLPIDALHVDLVRGSDMLTTLPGQLPTNMMLSLGLVDGRNVWRVDAEAALRAIEAVAATVSRERLMLAPSCSLLHVPIDLATETELPDHVRGGLAFAAQKCEELRRLADAAQGQDVSAWLTANRAAWTARRGDTRVTNPAVRESLAAVGDEMLSRSAPFPERKRLQDAAFNLPLMPTTTIGSYPQTSEIRSTRRRFKNGELDPETYVAAMQGFIKDVVDCQEALGLDVLVHGEPERNDMVEYFGEQLNGYCFTRNGWVQSYGSRCVKPPIIYGDVSRPKAMTVDWMRYAQSLTGKPMKGMLTGPVTMLCWSFVRNDQPRSETCRQIALALRAEVLDLEKAGIRIIQIDEAALREGLPLRRRAWNDYLRWAVDAFRLTANGVDNTTQIHTHMCYSEFNEILDWIARMDADVISIEASRSRMELLEAFHRFDYPNDIGPGVYDIHSPRVPSVDEMVDLLRLALDVLPAERLWVNPDCGLKTRAWPETLEALANLVAAAKQVRAAAAS